MPEVALQSGFSPLRSAGCRVFGIADPVALIHTETHRSILQALDRWMKYPTGEFYLAAEAFQGTGPQWDTVPLIFAQVHPEDFDAVVNDLPGVLASLQDYQGRPASIAGNLSGSDVVIPGQPRLESQVTLEPQQGPVTLEELQDLYQKGRLSLSTGFSAVFKEEGKPTGKVTPNHVLLFVTDDQAQPRDKAAMLLNMVGDRMDAANIGKKVSEKNRSKFKQILDLMTTLFSEISPAEEEKQEENAANQETHQEDEKMTTDLKNQVEALEQTLANKEAEIQTLTEKNTALSNKVAEMEKARKDAEWATLKNTLPLGLVDTEEKETNLRNLAETNPLEFANQLAQVKMKAPTAEEGHDQVPSGTGKPGPNKGIGLWNAVKRQYED